MKTLRLLVLLPCLLAACATPYRPPVVVHDSTPFPGLAALSAGGARPVDLILVHGMCTHDAAWVDRNVERIAGAVTAQAPGAALQSARRAAADNAAVELLDSTRRVGAGTVRFHGILWSPLTAPLKRQLAYDNTGDATDCAGDAVCRPVRGRLNGVVKDKLLNDCLADVLVYEGNSRDTIRDTMAGIVAQVIDADPDSDAPLVVVAESLGSKMLFDALASMLESSQPRLQALGRRAARRLALIFMAGNQLPILALAEQDVVARAMPEQDTLQRFLDLRRRQAGLPGERSGDLRRLSVVAVTDPNDLLSYRLLPARYAASDVAVADVLVSNDTTWFGLIENPVTAHLGYLANPDVGAIIACGWPRAAVCR